MPEETQVPSPLAMPDYEQLQNELEVFELMTAGYVGSILRAARLIPDDKWNWSYSERTPTAREICGHTFAWLWCDRQQIQVPDRARHRPTPDPPSDRQEMISMLQAEAREWQILVRSLSTDQLEEGRVPWEGDPPRLIRSFLFHMGQNVIYKAGQIWMLAFELGLDGTEPYDAPYPNAIYGFTGTASWPAPRNTVI